jgi:hypothetical protein
VVFLGIVLAAAAVAAGAGVITANSSSASLNAFGQHVPGVHTESEVFIAGIIVATFVIAGLGLAWLSLLRSSRARREFRDLRDEREESLSALVRRNQQLREELARARSGAQSAPTTP